MELSFEGAIGDPPTLMEKFQYVVKQLANVHHRPSTWASAASACGSQKVMSIALYSSMPTDS